MGLSSVTSPLILIPLHVVHRFRSSIKSGRHQPDLVDDMLRIQWTACSGIGGRFRPDYAQDEPPDYYLWIDEKQYAIEVTTIMEQVEIGKQKLSTLSIFASFSDLVDKVKKDALSNNLLSGVYIVRFTKPISNFNKLKERLYKEILTIIQATKYAENTPEHIIYKSGRQQISIQKLDNQKNSIGISGPRDGKSEVDIVEKICRLVEETIIKKGEKLRNVPSPIILLLYDAYHFAHKAMYKACLERFINLSHFHTLFLVPDDLPGMILYSEDSKWYDLG